MWGGGGGLGKSGRFRGLIWLFRFFGWGGEVVRLFLFWVFGLGFFSVVGHAVTTRQHWGNAAVMAEQSRPAGSG